MDGKDPSVNSSRVDNTASFVNLNASHISLQVVERLDECAVVSVPSREFTKRVTREENIIFTEKSESQNETLWGGQTRHCFLRLLDEVKFAVTSLKAPLADGGVCVACKNESLVCSHIETQAFCFGAHNLSNKVEAILFYFEQLDSTILTRQVQVLSNQLGAPNGRIDTVLALDGLSEQVPFEDDRVEARGDQSSCLSCCIVEWIGRLSCSGVTFGGRCFLKPVNVTNGTVLVSWDGEKLDPTVTEPDLDRIVLSGDSEQFTVTRHSHSLNRLRLEVGEPQTLEVHRHALLLDLFDSLRDLVRDDLGLLGRVGTLIFWRARFTGVGLLHFISRLIFLSDYIKNWAANASRCIIKILKMRFTVHDKKC